MNNKFPDPYNRKHLMDSLRPPVGYTLDYAIGTSFSLDLFALLTVPLSFSFFDYEDTNGKPISDPVVLFEALRRYSDKIKIFCQAGHTYEVENLPIMHIYLENSVIMVEAPDKKGVFHPKIWLLRFIDNDRHVFYRFMCLSRNLTFDRCWDTVLIMEGIVTPNRQKAYSKNNPLGEFIDSLPSLALNKMSKNDIQKINKIQKEIRRTKFELPEGINDYQFFHYGINGNKGFRDDYIIDKIAIISPFIDNDFIKELINLIDAPKVLISRTESLQQLSKADLSKFKKVYNLSEYADPENQEGQNSQENSDGNNKPLEMNGLHAKIFIMESGWDALILTGSANATHAAFHHNVEFMTELSTRKSEFGIDKILNEGNKDITSFRNLLEEFQYNDQHVEIDANEKKLDYEADNLWRLIVGSELKINIVDIGIRDTYKLVINQNKKLDITDSIKVTCRPISLKENHSLQLIPNTPVEFDLSIVSITSFIVFEVTINKYGLQKTRRFVLNFPLTNAPENRNSEILKHTFKDKANVMRLLLLILDVTNPGLGTATQNIRNLIGNSTEQQNKLFEQPLFEILIKTLSNYPEKLDHFKSTIDQLTDSLKGTDLLPEGIDQILKPILEVRKEMAK